MFHLHHYECLELYCRIISKVEGDTPLSEFKNYQFLEDKINASKNLVYTRSITDQINKCLYQKRIGLDEVQQLSIPVLGKKTFYELASSVRLKHPFLISESDLKAFSKYLDNPEYTIHKIPANQGIPSKREWRLIGTKWTLYHFEEKMFKVNSQDPGEPFVSISSVEFDLFNRVKIQSPTTKNSKPEDYLGRYQILNEQFLLLELVTKEGNLKRLRIEVLIGKYDDFDLVLGQYHNLDNSIYSGTLILIKELQNSIRIPKHVSFSSEEATEEVPDFVLRYLKDKRMNQLRSPREVFTADNLIRWMSLKEKEKSNN
jgi:hypothetical protein